MGSRQESWIVVNIDRKESSGGFDDLGDAFFERSYASSLPAKDWLTLPVMTRKVDQWFASRQPVAQTGALSRLSVELIDQIFEHLAASASPFKLSDMIAFALTCTAVLAVGERHLLRALRTHHAHWVGGRLICLNDWTNWDDLPTGLLTDAETRELETRTHEYHHSAGQHGTLYEFALTLYKDGLCPEDREGDRAVANGFHLELHRAQYPTTHHRRKRERVHVSGEPWDDMRRFLAIYYAERPTEREGSINVLFNLSKTEYVRSDQLPKEFGLDSALISRICWCSDAEDFDMRCEGEYRKRLMRGPWAGDRFCIGTLDMLPEVFNGVEGKDMSEETRELLQHIWTLKYPAGQEVSSDSSDDT